MPQYLTHADVKGLQCPCGFPITVTPGPDSASVTSGDHQVLLVDELQKAVIACTKNPPCVAVLVIPALPPLMTVNGKVPVHKGDVVCTNLGPVQFAEAPKSLITIEPPVPMNTLDKISKPEILQEKPVEVTDEQSVSIKLVCHIDMIPASDLKWCLLDKQEHEAIVFSSIKGENVTVSGKTGKSGELEFKLPLSFFENRTVVLKVEYPPFVFRRQIIPSQWALDYLDNSAIYDNYLDDGHHTFGANDPLRDIRGKMELPRFKKESSYRVIVESPKRITFTSVPPQKSEASNINFWTPHIDVHSHITLTYYEYDYSLLGNLGSGRTGFFLNEPRENLDNLLEGYEAARKSNDLDSAIGVPLLLDGAYTAFYAIAPETQKRFLKWYERWGQILLGWAVDASKVEDLPLCPPRLKQYYPEPPKGLPYCFAKGVDDEPDYDKLLRTTIEHVKELAIRYKGRILPFLPFEPRRKNAQAILDAFLNKTHKVDTKDVKIFAGVKIYTRNGWLLSGNNRFYLPKDGNGIDKKVTNFLEFCAKENIPVLNHHSPGGFPPTSHLVPPVGCVEAGKEWCNAKKASWWIKGLPTPPDDSAADAVWLVWTSFAEIAMRVRYIQATSRPDSWQSVFDKGIRPRVCLAHAISEHDVLFHYYGEYYKEKFQKLDEDRIFEEMRKWHHDQKPDIYAPIDWLAAMGGGFFRKAFFSVARNWLKGLPSVLWDKENNSCILKHRIASFAYSFASAFIERCRDRYEKKGWLESLLTGTLDIDSPAIKEALDKQKVSWGKCYWMTAQEQNKGWLAQSFALIEGGKQNVYLDSSYFSNRMSCNSGMKEYSTREGIERRPVRLSLEEKLHENRFEVVIKEPTLLSLFLCEKVIADIFGPNGNKTLQTKVMFGSDWGVSTLEGFSVKDHWGFFHEAFFNNRFYTLEEWSLQERADAWQMFTSTNAAHFLFQ